MDDISPLKFLHRLRERRLVQWSIAYIAAAWVLLQAAELVFGIFDWPEVWLRRLSVALVFGFVIALVLAWYHGEKGQQKASGIEMMLLSAILLLTGWVLVSNDFGNITATNNQFEGRPSRRVTADSHFIAGPSWSPDSQSFVFMSEESGSRDLWIWSRDGTKKRLTDHPAEESQAAWSPDGRTILFVSSSGHGEKVDRSVFYGYSIGGDIWSVPAVGGDPRRIIDNSFNPSWSPDARQFTFDSSRSGARRIWIADADGANARQLSPDDADLAQHVRPAWSPDGKWIVFERKTGSQSGGANLIVVAADGSQSFALTEGTDRSMAPAWADKNRIVFSSDRSGALNLWQTDVDFDRPGPAGDPTQVTLGAGEDFDPAVASDGTLAYVALRRLQNLWQVGVDPTTLAFGDEPERMMSASWNDYAPAISIDNSRTVFSSDRTGNTDIWVLDSNGAQHSLTDTPGQDLQPVFSHDDSRILFFSNARGNDDIYVLSMDGGAPIPLTPSDSNDINPYWSSDSTRIAFASDRGGRSEVWIMNADGSDPRQLTTIGTTGHTARWSPDDGWILFTSVTDDVRDIWAVRSDGSEVRRLTNSPTQDAHGLWSPDGRTVIYLADHRQMIATDFENGGRRVLFDIGERIDYVHLSRDGTKFQFTRQNIEGDIWLIE